MSGHLLERVALVEERVRRAVLARRSTDPDPDDPFRGLYLSDDAVRRILDEPSSVPAPDQVDAERLAAAEASATAGSRLRALERGFGLLPLDVELLLIALVPDLDGRFEQLYGYLNDDVTRRRPSIGLALALCGVPAAAASARGRLAATAPLVVRGLLLVEEPERPFLGRSLRVPDRVTAHLLGDDTPDPRLADLVSGIRQTAAPESRLGAALSAGLHLAYLREPADGSARGPAAEALLSSGRAALALDLSRLVRDPTPSEAVVAAGREAGLTDAGLVAGPVEALADRADLIRALTALPVPVLLTGRASWDPHWSAAAPLLVDVERLGAESRRALWRAALAHRAPDVDLAATAPFLLTPDQVERAATTAYQQAVLAGGPLTEAHLLHGARAQNSSGLERLARRIEPAVGWDDLVLPDAVLGQLRELAARARHRDQVLGDWAMRPGGGRGRGVMALFAGDSGTGKTMSAEVIAGALGLDLYTVDLATVVDKYVGETEKNLERIFTEAAGVNAVLLFDEADAIFGKRSEVKDAHDRYANVESAYLLQRMETFDGLAVLATNLRANLDEAFTRRLDLVVDFPLPDAEQRTALWERCLGPALPRGTDLDLAFCGRSFDLAGGDIRSAAVTAAYLAAEAGRPVAMADLVAAVAREYRKLGRLCLESEFGPYLRLVR
ncbi:ATP-binding protein [Kitasatospora atroaurantiaca]|uniref:ATPase family protein associated with various cellular activities (AAA) n=1 Tax=Kitasatospora atroaurantiaca TaxID=285545 RepID=A0A561EZR4_9ACTN|nr:ATP-binding protein [Kitasatospora atroaurantiaca]TWE21099.1 ATPase family protein associated with various cellular activities (AAA) [Kitasatospora atroaurantiaca]